MLSNVLGPFPLSSGRPKGRVLHATGTPERRKRVRTRLSWQVALLALSNAQTVESKTLDLSSCGFYCKSPVPVAPGSRMTCILRVPAYHPERSDSILSLECKVRIVRVEPADDEGCFGFGCEIEDYRFLRS
jgi:hypothetical protein